MLAARDFNFILCVGVVACILQVSLVRYCTTINAVLLTFAIRLGSYTLMSLARVGLGFGPLGKLLGRKRRVKAHIA